MEVTRNEDKQFAPNLWIIFFTGCLLYVFSVAFHYVALAQDAARAVEMEVMQTSVLARDAELRALRAQINPHFLFNSLNSISALTSIDGARAREMCLLLADFLRLTLGMGEKSVIPFSDELYLLEKFLAIEKVRFGDRLRMEEKIEDDAKRCIIPALLLQPLLENAVHHGVEPATQTSDIMVRIGRRGNRVQARIENPYHAGAPAQKGNRMALENIRERLRLFFDAEATLVSRIEDGRYRVEIEIPYRSGGAAAEVARGPSG